MCFVWCTCRSRIESSDSDLEAPVILRHQHWNVNLQRQPLNKRASKVSYTLTERRNTSQTNGLFITMAVQLEVNFSRLRPLHRDLGFRNIDIMSTLYDFRSFSHDFEYTECYINDLEHIYVVGRGSVTQFKRATITTRISKNDAIVARYLTYRYHMCDVETAPLQNRRWRLPPSWISKNWCQLFAN